MIPKFINFIFVFGHIKKNVWNIIMISVYDRKKYVCIGAMAVPRFKYLWIIFGFTNKDKTEVLLVLFNVKLITTRLCCNPTQCNEKIISSQRWISSENLLIENLITQQRRVLEIFLCLLLYKNVTLRWIRWSKGRAELCDNNITPNYILV